MSKSHSEEPVGYNSVELDTILTCEIAPNTVITKTKKKDPEHSLPDQVVLLSERVYKETKTRAPYKLRKELHIEYGADWIYTSAYTLEDVYIGSPKDAHYLCVKRGIYPEPKKPYSNICTIGFSKKEKKWFGWSHRAIAGFKIGSKVKRGDCAYKPCSKTDFKYACTHFWSDSNHIYTKSVGKTSDEGQRGVYTSWMYDNKVKNESLRGTINGIFTPYPETFGKGEWEAKTMEDARQMAIDFADDVA